VSANVSRSHFTLTPPATTAIYTLSLHDALPILKRHALDAAATFLELVAEIGTVIRRIGAHHRVIGKTKNFVARRRIERALDGKISADKLQVHTATLQTGKTSRVEMDRHDARRIRRNRMPHAHGPNINGKVRRKLGVRNSRAQRQGCCTGDFCQKSHRTSACHYYFPVTAGVRNQTPDLRPLMSTGMESPSRTSGESSVRP